MIIYKFPQSFLSLTLHVIAEHCMETWWGGGTREMFTLIGRAVQSRSGPTARGSNEATVCHPPVNEQKAQMKCSFRSRTFNSQLTIAPSLLSLPCRAQHNCQLSTELVTPVSFITTLHEPPRKHPVSNSKSIVAWVFVSAGTWLPSCCSKRPFVYSPIS
jgi:hypothetical protein